VCVSSDIFGIGRIAGKPPYFDDLEGKTTPRLPTRLRSENELLGLREYQKLGLKLENHRILVGFTSHKGLNMIYVMGYKYL